MCTRKVRHGVYFSSQHSGGIGQADLGEFKTKIVYIKFQASQGSFLRSFEGITRDSGELTE